MSRPFSRRGKCHHEPDKARIGSAGAETPEADGVDATKKNSPLSLVSKKPAKLYGYKKSILAVPSTMTYTLQRFHRESSLSVYLERFTIGRLSFISGTVKPWKSPSRAGGFLGIIT